MCAIYMSAKGLIAKRNILQSVRIDLICIHFTPHRWRGSHRSVAQNTNIHLIQRHFAFEII